jgi:hypothetical protein
MTLRREWYLAALLSGELVPHRVPHPVLLPARFLLLAPSAMSVSSNREIDVDPVSLILPVADETSKLITAPGCAARIPRSVWAEANNSDHVRNAPGGLCPARS